MTVRKMTWASVVAGGLFIRVQPIVLGAISLDFCRLIRGATALPMYARDILTSGVGAGFTV